MASSMRKDDVFDASKSNPSGSAVRDGDNETAEKKGAPSQYNYNNYSPDDDSNL